MGKPTPGPWHRAGALGEWVNDAREMNICRMNTTVSLRPNGKMTSDGPRSHEANAEFIVRAVNSHEELLEAAKGALARYPELNTLRAAIDKAEGNE